MPEGNAFYPLMHKRRYFEQERELRAIIPGSGTDFEEGGTSGARTHASESGCRWTSIASSKRSESHLAKDFSFPRWKW